MSDPLAGIPFERLELDKYLNEFDSLHAENNFSTLKLESAQHFIEPGNESWEAYAKGHWAEALRVINDSVDELTDYYSGLVARGVKTERVRVIDLPLTPYLQWECYALKARCDAGERIRVVPSDVTRSKLGFEPRELLFLGEDRLYDIQYDADGKLAGALRHTDSPALETVKLTLQELFESAGELTTFFDDHVRSLPEPSPI